MNIQKLLLILFLILSISSCNNKKKKTISSDLQVDHLNIWVENPQKAKEKLMKIGFTAVPDSISAIHYGQGTAGKYFNFLNSYLELIFVYNKKEFENNNLKNKDLDFTERANFKTNGASPFSVALNIEDYNIAKIPFEKINYHQDWMPKYASIFSAKNSKLNLHEPSIFVVYPEIESDYYENLADLEKIPEEYAYVRTFYKHKNGAKKITSIVITTTDLDTKTKTIKAINGIKNTTIKKGKAHKMELFFDNNIQGKTFDLRPELPLIIYL